MVRVEDVSIVVFALDTEAPNVLLGGVRGVILVLFHCVCLALMPTQLRFKAIGGGVVVEPPRTNTTQVSIAATTPPLACASGIQLTP